MLAYSFDEALASLRRSGKSAVMSMGTIGIAFLALGGFLLVFGNLERVVTRWMDAAEVSVFLRDDIDEASATAIEEAIVSRPGTLKADYVSKAQALERFKADFPELVDVAATAGENVNPFPASFDVRLQPGPDVANEAAVMAEALSGMDGVADVQFDRRWLERVLSLLSGARLGGLAVAVVLLLGAAFTVAAVVRLSLHARRDELDIMALVGAPMSVIRGPFVVEGMLLGGIGALLALAILAVGFRTLGADLSAGLSGMLGGEPMRFLGLREMALLVAAGLGVGALAGLVASRSAG